MLAPKLYPKACFLLLLFWFGLTIPTQADSLDIWHWRNPSPQGNDLRSAAFGNGKFVLVGDAGALVTSTDGLNWTSQSSHVVSGLSGAAYGNGVFVAVGTNGVITKSSDGDSWVAQNSGFTNHLFGVKFGNGLFVAVGQSGTVLTSSNGVDWAAQNSGTTQNLNAVTYGKSQFLAVGDAGSSKATVISSTSGIDWIPGSFPFGLNLTEAASKDDDFFAVMMSNGQLYTSTNDSSWVKMAGTWQDYGLSSSPGLIELVDKEGGIWFSPDAKTWTPHFISPYYAFNSIVYGNSNFVAFGTNGLILSSNNTTNWTRGDNGNQPSFMSVVYGSNQFVAVGKNGTIKTSTNGSAWNQQSIGTNNAFFSVAYGAGVYAAIGNSGVFSSPDGVHWTNQTSLPQGFGFRVTYGNGMFVAILGTGVYTSTDAFTWVLSTNLVSVNAVGFGGGLFVAGGLNTPIFTSPDAISWTSHPLPPGAKNPYVGIYCASYGKGVYVAAGYPGSSVLTSTDGVNWTNQPTHFNGSSISSMTFANNMFVAAASDGAILTSDDGMVWTPHQTAASKELFGVAYGASSFVLVGDNGTILQSDLINTLRLDGTYKPFQGGFELSVTGEPGRVYRVQSSDSLASKNWQDLFTFTNTAPAMTFLDTSVTNLSQRFYRAVTP